MDYSLFFFFSNFSRTDIKSPIYLYRIRINYFGIISFTLEKFRDSLAKMVACKMSIKANTFIDKASMESLINDLRKCKNPFNCPHGRPAIIHFSIYELEKMFKRSM